MAKKFTQLPAVQSLTSADIPNTNDTVTLKPTPIGGGNPSATWTRVGQLANVALSQASQIAAGWYDLVLAGANSSTTAFARGLYLVS